MSRTDEVIATAAVPAGAAPSPRRHTWAAPLAVILLGPLLGVLVLRAPLVNTMIYRDPWFYSAYGWELSHFVEVFGWLYYAVRFPVNLPIGLAADVFGAETGYLLLRFVILALTGWALYAVLRRFASVPVSCTGVALMTLNPFFLRLMLWDYTTFITLPCTLAGAAVWYLGASTGRQRWTALASGALLAAAVFANPLAGFVIPVLYAVEGVAALRAGLRAVGHYAVRLALSAVGAVLVFLVGYLGYMTHLGTSLSPRDIVQPTLDVFGSYSQVLSPFQVPARTWLAHEPRVYAPPLACGALVVAMGRSLLATTIRARLAQFAIAYTAFFWLYRKFFTSSVVETWWAYSMTAVTIAFALPLVLDALERRDGARGVRGLLGAMLAGTIVADLLVRSFDDSVLSIYDAIHDHVPLLIAELAAVAAAAVAIRLLRGAARSAAVAAFAAGLAFVSLTPADYIGIHSPGEFSKLGSGAELSGYGAAHDLTELLARVDQPDARVFAWTSMSGDANIVWVDMPHQFGGIQNAEKPVPLTRLTAAEIETLRNPLTRGVLVFDGDAAAVDGAAAVLRRNGFRTLERQRGTWAGGRLRYALIDLVGKP
jgi:hypothetical protein